MKNCRLMKMKMKMKNAKFFRIIKIIIINNLIKKIKDYYII